MKGRGFFWPSSLETTLVSTFLDDDINRGGPPAVGISLLKHVAHVENHIILNNYRNWYLLWAC